MKKIGDAPSKPVGRKAYSILYVEDEDQNWEIAELSLRDKYNLTRASSAREAFSKLHEHDYDCILMDIQLSGSDLNGIEITQILSGLYDGTSPEYATLKKSFDSPIIFVTAYNSRYQKDDLIQAGAVDMISKPVDFARLALAISRHIVRKTAGA